MTGPPPAFEKCSEGLTIYLTPSVAAALRARGDLERRNVSKLARFAIEEYLAARGRRSA